MGASLPWTRLFCVSWAERSAGTPRCVLPTFFQCCLHLLEGVGTVCKVLFFKFGAYFIRTISGAFGIRPARIYLNSEIRFFPQDLIYTDDSNLFLLPGWFQ